MKKFGAHLVLIHCALCLLACQGKETTSRAEEFTHIDSLTETYLMLQDSMLQSWNVMVKDENEKIHAMHDLLHTLLASKGYDKDQLVSLEQQLEQLERIRFTQKTMSNPHVVEEYDFSSNSLITELVSLAESDPEIYENENLLNIVDNIRMADQRVNIYREEYDGFAEEFNFFIEKNKEFMKEIDQNANLQKRPLFQMASDE